MKMSIARAATHIFLPAAMFDRGEEQFAALRRGAAWELYDEPQAIFTGPFIPGYNISGMPGISDLKAHVWWASWNWWTRTDWSAGPPSASFFAMLDQIRLNQNTPTDEMATTKVDGGGGVYYDSVLGDSYLVKQTELVFQGTELGYGVGPTLRAVRDGRCDWTYHSTSDAVTMPQRHPYNQIALGSEIMELTTYINNNGVGFPIVKPRMYRTPLKLLKKSKDFYLDDSVTFEQVPTRFTPESLGAVITLGRTGGYLRDGLQGDLPLSKFAPDTSSSSEEIMFYGLELEFV